MQRSKRQTAAYSAALHSYTLRILAGRDDSSRRRQRRTFGASL